MKAKTNVLMLDGAPSFVIKSIIAEKCDGIGVDTPDVTVAIVMPNDVFKRIKCFGTFVSDVNDQVNSINKNIPAYCPTVGGLQDRASKGIKTLRFTYHIENISTAKALGFEAYEHKDGSWGVYYSRIRRIDLIAGINK